MAIYYFEEDIDSITLKKRDLNKWFKNCIFDFKFQVGDINYIFCSDNYLHQINVKYLNHDYFTDVITFNNNMDDIISGDIYISVDRISENAELYNTTFYDELYRVMIHGLLHLLGFNDKTNKQQIEMRRMEDLYLSKFIKN